MKETGERKETKKEESYGVQTMDKKCGNAVFLQELSAEIRSVLSEIAAITYELKTSMSGETVVVNKINQIEEKSDTLYNIANSIVDFTDLSQEQLKLVNAPFSVKTLMGNLFTELDALANRKNVQLFTNIQDVEDVQINADKSRFEQVLKGYIEYAVEHSPSEGNVFIILRYQYLFHNTIKVIVEIETAGTNLYHAISSDYSFLQQKKYRERRYGVNGINLYICNHLLEKMNGTIKYGSQNEFESRMHLSFNMETANVATAEEKKAYSFENEKIMILDVDKEWNSINTTFFEEIGLKYSLSNDFEEAMDMIGEAEDENNPYCICLLKWNALNMNTIKMVNEIRDVFGSKMIIMALTKDETIGVQINKIAGLNYIVAQSWVRSLIFDTLIRLRKGKLDNKDDSSLEIKYNFENRRVLLVEDVLLNAELVIKMLKQVNVSVTEAVNGLEAVSIYNKKPEGYFNCILMDVNMPVMDGYSATKEIRNSGKEDSKTIPIFAMTANAMAEDVQQAISVGMDGHIAKPVEMDKLYSLLNKTFSTMENDQFIDLKKQTEKLQQKNDELLRKAEHDHLTGLLNRHGFERKIAAYSESDKPIGLMLIDLDKFKGINDSYGHQVGDKVLHKLATTLQKYFKATDDIIRFGGDEFAVILTNLASDRSFVVKNVEAINNELGHPQDGLPAFSISTGVAFSEKGYSNELYTNADEALYIIKENGRCGCKIYSEIEQIVKVQNQNNKNSSNIMLYIDNDEGKLISDKETLVKAVLEENSIFGVISGFYNKQFSIYSISRHILVQLGYTLEEFLNITDGEFKKMIYPPDRLCVYEVESIGKIHNRILRLANKNGNPIWFRVSVIPIYSGDGRKMWCASFRRIEMAVVKELCESNCIVVGIISRTDQKIIFEKGTEDLKGYAVDAELRYDYDTLLRFSIEKQIAIEEQKDVYQKSCLKNVVKNLEDMNSYSFSATRLGKTDNKKCVKYRFRYIDYQKDAIVCTQEFL